MHRILINNELSATWLLLVAHSTHDVHSNLAAFAGLGSAHFILHIIISYGKLHTVDRVVIRHFCYLANTLISSASTLPISLLMGIANLLYSTIPPVSRFPLIATFSTQSRIIGQVFQAIKGVIQSQFMLLGHGLLWTYARLRPTTSLH